MSDSPSTAWSAAPSCIPSQLPCRETLIQAILHSPDPPPQALPGAVRIKDGEIASLRDLLQNFPDPSCAPANSTPPELDTCAGTASSAQSPRYRPLESRRSGELSYDDFFVQYLLPNQPVLVEGVAATWRAAAEWGAPGEDGAVVNTALLGDAFGDAVVQVADCSAEEGAERRHMTVREYCRYWEARRAWLASGSSSPPPPRPDEAARADEVLYLKDWHLAAEYPDYGAYCNPPFFQDDWLNWYHDVRHAGPAATAPAGPPAGDRVECADYRFVYLGPRGSHTALHSDVLRSFSWSVNIHGRKRWLLFPPCETLHLLDARGRGLPQDAEAAAERSSCGAASPSASTGAGEVYPHMARALSQAFEVIQGPGDAIFVPSGWHHQVENLEDTLSVNHNWMNGCNLRWMWALLRRDHAEAANAIADCRALMPPQDFARLCQRNLKLNSSMDFCDLRTMLQTVAAAEMRCVGRWGAGSSAAGPPEGGAIGAAEAGGAAGPRPEPCSPRELMAAFNLQRCASTLREMAEEDIFALEQEQEQEQEHAGTTARSHAKHPRELAEQIESLLGSMQAGFMCEE